MGIISVQIQPDLIRGFDACAVDALRAFQNEDSVRRAWSDSGDDDGPYINMQFETDNPSSLWPVLRAAIIRQGLLAGCIVTCTGEQGWDDYLLLHHFDHSVRLASLPSS